MSTDNTAPQVPAKDEFSILPIGITPASVVAGPLEEPTTTPTGENEVAATAATEPLTTTPSKNAFKRISQAFRKPVKNTSDVVDTNEATVPKTESSNSNSLWSCFKKEKNSKSALNSTSTNEEAATTVPTVEVTAAEDQLATTEVQTATVEEQTATPEEQTAAAEEQTATAEGQTATVEAQPITAEEEALKDTHAKDKTFIQKLKSVFPKRSAEKSTTTTATPAASNKSPAAAVTASA